MSEVFDKMSRVFTQKEISDMRQLEGVIERGNAFFVEVGAAAAEIKSRKLYHMQYDTWDEYCEKRWGWSRQWLHETIEASGLVRSLPENCQPVVDTVKKARALEPVPPRRRARVIEDAVEASNGHPTARDIKEAAERVTTPPTAPKPAEKPPQKEILLDATGWPVPDNLEKLFHRVDEVRSQLRNLSALRGMLRRVKENRDQLWASVNFDSAGMEIDKAYAEIKEAIPFAVCPYCSGHDDTRSHCTNCRKRGVVSEFFWKHAIPEELKAVREKSCKK